MKKLVLTVFFLQLFTIQSQSFNPPENKNKCKEDLRKLYAKQNNMQAPVEGKVYYLNYSVKSTPNKEKAVEQKTDVKIYSNVEKTYFESNTMEIYQDKKVSVSVIPSSKTIIVNNIYKETEKTKENKLKYLTVLQDTLFDLSEVEQCDLEKTTTGETIKKVKVKLTDKGVKLFKMTSVDFFLKKDADFINSYTINYSEKQRFKKVQISFNEFDYDYKTDKLNKPILSLVFDANNKLLNQYKDYKLIDNRNKKK